MASSSSPTAHPRSRSTSRTEMAPSSSPSVFVLLLALSLQLRPSTPHASFVFGDSLVDVGNNNYLLTLSRADSSPYGIDFAASAGRPTGRFTNGRTIFDIIVEAVGGDRAFPPPYLAAPSRTDGEVRGGVNYASGSSGVLDETGSLFIERLPLGKQIKYFEETRSGIVGAWGVNGTDEFLHNAVFAIATGSNDILNYLEPFEPFIVQNRPPPEALQDAMLSNLTLHLRRLYELGARKFIVVGVGPLGCIPYVRAVKLVAGGRCSSVANGIVQGYNMKLRRRIVELNREMSPEAMFVYANSYDIVLDIIRNYRPYGFENANDPCCGVSFPPFLCSRNAVSDNSSSMLCQDRSKFVFWDSYHPTEATNIIVAKKILDGDEGSTFPISVRKLYGRNR